MKTTSNRGLSTQSSTHGGRRLLAGLGLPAALLLSACGPELVEQDAGAEQVKHAAAALGAEQTVVLEPVADAMVSSGAPNNHFGHNNELLVDPLSEQVYLRFDLGKLPPGAKVTGATLSALAYGGWAYGGDGNVGEASIRVWVNQPTESPSLPGPPPSPVEAGGPRRLPSLASGAVRPPREAAECAPWTTCLSPRPSWVDCCSSPSTCGAARSRRPTRRPEGPWSCSPGSTG